MKIRLFIFIFLPLLLLAGDEAEGSCSGDQPVNEQNWEINQLTHCWDEVISVNDIEINSGGMRLDNVTLNASGKIIINAETEWIASTINHHSTKNADLIDLQKVLTLRGTNLSINAPENVYEGSGYQGIKLSTDSKLIITDIDGNPDTEHDASNVSSMNWNISDPYNTALEFWTGGTGQSVEFSNSVFNHLFAVRTTGDNVVVKNNSFYYCGTMALAFGDNLTFENNYAYNHSYGYWAGGWLIDFYGDNGIIRNNIIEKGDSGGIFVDSGTNHQIYNNTFSNLTGWNTGDFGIFSSINTNNTSWFNNSFKNIDTNAFWAFNATNSSIINNDFDNVKIGFIGGGTNLTINNNNFDTCGWSYAAGSVGGCIVIGGSNIDVDTSDASLFGNTMTNVEEVGIMIVTGENHFSNIEVYDNNIDDAWAGIHLTTFGDAIERPDNVTIYNNTFYDNFYGVRIYKSYTPQGGTDNVVSNNFFYNSSYGLYLDGTPKTYHGFLITDNYIEANITGIFTGDLINTIILNNVIYAENGISGIDTTDISVKGNLIYAENKGIITSGVTGEIENNEIIGKCENTNCDTIFFTKVAQIGAEFIDRSILSFENNNITLFNNLVRISKSDIVLENNILDYGEVGLSLEDTVNHTAKLNHVVNSSKSISISNSLNVLIQQNNFSYFDKGIYSVNSSISLLTNNYIEGDLCLEFIDSIYSVANYDNFGCSSAFIIEKYNVAINILTDDGVPSANHQFYYHNALESEKIHSNTLETGFSDYNLLTTRKVDNSGLDINFNNYTFGYYHNDILNLIVLKIDKNQTISAYLDVIPPSTFIYCDSPLINTDTINLNLNIVSGSEDFYNFDIFYLINDGENFAEWQLFGTYNETIIEFTGQDSTKYRFKSVSRDIYGNVETKTTHDYEVSVDITTPNSYFEGILLDYYFSSNDKIHLSWSSDNADVVIYNLEIYYNNFSNAFLDPESVVWALNSTYQYDQEGMLTFVMDNVGHYGFKITSQDESGNVEIKEQYDFIINYDPSGDSLSLIDVPSKWGEDTLIIEYLMSDLNLDFDVFISLEAIENPGEILTWYSHIEVSDQNSITLTGLQDSMRYYVVVKSYDLAGNIEDPLNTIEIFSSNNSYDLFFDLRYIPLGTLETPIIVEIDENLDGNYNLLLDRGYNLTKLNATEYYLDTTNQRIIFGGSQNGGYAPTEGTDNIRVSYSGVHAIFEVFTSNPPAARDLSITHTNLSEIVFTFDIEKDLLTCKVQRTTDKAKGWFNEKIISPCEEGYHAYYEIEPDLDKTYYYRVLTEDEFGHSSMSIDKVLAMEEVVLLYETNEKTSTNQFGMDGILPIMLGVGIIMLFAGGFLIYQSKNQVIDDNIQLIESKPIAKYKIEQVYLIYIDGRLLEYMGTGEAQTDTDIMSGMLTAINDFVQDSFQAKGDLGAIDYGDNTVVLQRGKSCYLAAVVYGEVDKYLRSKLANIVRSFESQNTKLGSWNGDVDEIIGSKDSLDPLIKETIGVTREMVDNYLSEKEIVVNTTVERTSDLVKLDINISNYSSEVIENCSLSPIFNSALLAISNIRPDISYSFSENSFFIGDLGSFNEIQFRLELIIRSGNPSEMDLDLIHTHKGRETRSNNKISLL